MIPHQDKFRRRSGQRGSVLVICMVLAALGTIGVAAWFSLLDARGHQVETNLLALERRIAAKNSRALASRVLYSSFLHANSGLDADTVYALPDGKGRATIRAYSTIPLKSTSTGNPSQDGATPLVANGTDIAVDLFDGIGETRWIFSARSRNPALGGDLLSIHTPVLPADGAPLVSGNLRVKGRAVFWDAVVRDVGSGIRADEYLLPDNIGGSTTFATTTDTPVLPLNYPHYRRTTGNASGGPSYRGELELVKATVNPQNAYESRFEGIPSVRNINGQTKNSEKNGTKSRASSDPVADAAVVAWIEASSPQTVADTLSQNNSLSSPVLLATVQKSNPPLNNRQLLKVFDAQADIPEDALTEVMGAIDKNDYSNALDAAFIEMNDRNSTYYNAPGDGMVQIFLDRPDLTHVILSEVSQLRLFGQPDAARAEAAAAMPPLLILVHNSAGLDLNRMEFFHGNERPLVLVVSSDSTAPAMPEVVFKGNSAFPTWRIIFDLQNTGLAFDGSGISGCRIVGGIRTNHRVTVTGGAVTLQRDFTPALLTNLLSRDAWIETFRR